MTKPVIAAENEKWVIKIFFPPREHPPPHVHVIHKGKKGREMIVYLETFEYKAGKEWSKQAIKKVLKFVYENFDELIARWNEVHK